MMVEPIAAIDELVARLAGYRDVDENPGDEVELGIEILKNDIDALSKRFPEGSEDRDRLQRDLHPAFASYLSYDPEDFWDSFGDDLTKSLQVVKHRLEQGQTTLAQAESDELIVDAGMEHTAYVKLRDIVQQASSDIFIVDPYVGSDLLAVLTNTTASVAVRILTYRDRVPYDFSAELTRFVTEHGNSVETRCGTTDFHDRFLVVDSRVYHSGASFKDLGKKMSLISEIKDEGPELLKRLEARWQVAQAL